MGKRIVIALGGNALGSNLPEQMDAVKYTSKAIADLIEEGHEVVVSHGNGPQVGMIQKAMSALVEKDPNMTEIPLSVCGAMSQAYIGYDLQNALREELMLRGIEKAVSTVITQVVVDPADEAFKNPTKPIGNFMAEDVAKTLAAENGYSVVEDSGRGWRRVVASPRPQSIVEIETIKTLVAAGQVVVSCGGGGIPVMKTEKGHLRGVAAVIDKDFCSAKLAEMVDADCLIILTAVEKVAINYGKPNQEWLSSLTPAQARVLMNEGHFAPGSMLPKVEAAVQFASSREGRYSLITLLEKAKDGIAGKTGTIITSN